MNYHLTLKSSNAKTGPIPVSTAPRKNCSLSCPLYDGSCYALSGPLALHWRAVSEGRRGVPFAEHCEQVRALPDLQLWRAHQAGDLPGDGVEIDREDLEDLTDANRGRRGFTYTAYPMTAGNLEAVKAANDAGFTINLSAYSLEDADRKLELNIAPVTVVLAHDAPRASLTPAGNKVAVCPATYREDVTCATCQLCQRQDRGVIVGFPAHGTQWKKVEIKLKEAA